MAKYMLLKDTHIHGLNFLIFVYIVLNNVEAALTNARSAVLERLELQIFFTLSLFRYFTIPKMLSLFET